MNRIPSALIVSTALCYPLADAHHSFSAEFDATKAVELRGTVTKVEWSNPHVYFYVDVKDPKAKTIHYAIEGAAPNVLRRMRWGKNSIRVGDAITVSGFRAKNGSNTVNAVTVLLPDGSSLFAGSSYYSPEHVERAK
jgi:hypothetical protein